ncbi:Arm DNA-binding domain-containing protein [Undibacterium sp. Tian12W]|uniref:Arm DNA-binding domain-containing protein n=1 Tax=Undibacterium sp. Tian12W TaxID=3413054 RepID=UPI003BF439C1
MALTVKQIDAAKPKDKPYKIRDIEGLYLYASTAGSKHGSAIAIAMSLESARPSRMANIPKSPWLMQG